jgi:hypothetical protein
VTGILGDGIRLAAILVDVCEGVMVGKMGNRSLVRK